MTLNAARVLFVGAFPPPERMIFGGMVSSCRALLQSSFVNRVDLELLDSTQVDNPVPPLIVRAIYSLRRFVRYVRRFEQRRPDAVILFAAVGASLLEKGAMAWYARCRGVPALLFPRGGLVVDRARESRFTRWWVTLAFRGARKVVCQSARWQNFAVDLIGFDKSDAPVVTNWTALPELVAIGRARKEWNAAPRLLFLGWLDREKGVDELLRVCRSLVNVHSFTLQIVGEGNFSSAAREFVVRHSLESTIKFRGWLRGEELLRVFADSDVLVLPSWAEGLPNAMIEAMAARLAVVVSRVGGVPDVAVNEEHALLVPPRDENALEGALERVMSDVELRRRIADSGFAMACERFGVERAVDEIIDQVQSVRQ